MAWLTQWWTFFATLIIVFVPGLVAAWTIGLRRLGAFAFAPVGSVAMISLVATAYGVLRIPWTLLSAVVGLVVVAAMLVAWRLLFRIRASPSAAAGGRWPVVVALFGAATLISARFGLYIGDPSNVSQSNDAPFHLGAVRAIIEHADAASFGLAGLLDPSAIGDFYPGAWHGLVSLVVLSAGAGIPEASNVLSIIVAALVWPLGVAWLTYAVTGRRVASVAAAALSPVLLSFPLLLIQYGILYPYLLAVALLPGAIALVVSRSRRAAEGGWAGADVAALALGVFMAIGALTTSHPSVLLPWALATLMFGVGGAVLACRRTSTTRGWRALAIIACVVGSVGLVTAWWIMSRRVSADYWGTVRSVREATLDVVSSGYAGTQSAWWMSILIVLGLVVALIRTGMRWVALTWLALVTLYGIAAAIDAEWIRLPLVGPWYSDTYRLAALIPVMAIPLAAYGVSFLLELVAARLPRGHAATVGSARGVVAEWVVAGTLLAVAGAIFAAQPVVQRYHLANDVREERSPFVIAGDTWLSLDERALLERLPREVGGGVILANPGTGAAFGYALSGADVFPAKWQLPSDTAYGLLSRRLPEAASDPAVCDAVKELDAAYVLDFGPGDEGTGREMLPGFTGFADRPGFELVDEQGRASLWRITACS